VFLHNEQILHNNFLAVLLRTATVYLCNPQLWPDNPNLEGCDPRKMTFDQHKTGSANALTLETRVPSQSTKCWFCNGQTGTWTGFSLSTSVASCIISRMLHHIHASPMLYYLQSTSVYKFKTHWTWLHTLPVRKYVTNFIRSVMLIHNIHILVSV
jgi:hypothetical protein